MSNFSCQFSTALRRAGHEVTDWDGCYPVIHHREERQDPRGTYLPADAATYDVIQVNWHPATINHYVAGHFPLGPVLSVYLHDLPPWSSCPFLDRADVPIAAEPLDGCLTLPYPVADWVTDLPEPNQEFTVGWSGIRGDGLEELRAICQDRGWTLNASDPDRWLPFDDEVRRLARSTVNVCWYREKRGISGAASTCLASRRPLLINHSPMLRHLADRTDIYCGVSLAQSLTSLADTRLALRRPLLTVEVLSWSRATFQLEAAWQEVRHV